MFSTIKDCVNSYSCCFVLKGLAFSIYIVLLMLPRVAGSFHVKYLFDKKFEETVPKHFLLLLRMRLRVKRIVLPKL